MNTYTQEEIMKFIKENDLDIKKLAAIAATLKSSETGEPDLPEITPVEKTDKAKAKPALSFELTLCNYPDFVITRTTPATVKQLVIMPSKDSYYITSVKNGSKTDIQELTDELYAEFTSGMDPIKMPDDFWCKEVVKGKRCYERMNSYLHARASGKTMIQMIKDMCAPKLDMDANYDSYKHEEFEVYAKLPILWKEFHAKEKIKQFMLRSRDTVLNIQEQFGLNNARDYMNALDLSLIDTASIGGYYYYNRYSTESKYPDSRIPQIDMEYEAFKEYTIYKATRFGYAFKWSDFFQTWEDALEMQKHIYHKIKVKYPAELPTFHNQMSYKQQLHKAEIDAANFAYNSERVKKFEWKMDEDEGRFIFLAPKAPEDFYDEATQQSNCLAGYVQRFADGEDIIMFMRDKKTPEDSEVTIEVTNDGAIKQAYAHNNTYLNKEQAVAVHKWAKKFKFVENYNGFNEDYIKED